MAYDVPNSAAAVVSWLGISCCLHCVDSVWLQWLKKTHLKFSATKSADGFSGEFSKTWVPEMPESCDFGAGSTNRKSLKSSEQWKEMAPGCLGFL